MKIIRTVFLFLLFYGAFYVIQNVVTVKFYNEGLECYNKKNYVCAVKNMKKVLQFNPNNLDARYYYVKSLSTFGPSYYREKILYHYANGHRDDSAKTVAKNTLYDWRKQIMRKYPYNYIDQALSGKHIIRWSNNSFPLTVYLANFDDEPDYFKPVVMSAFDRWAKTINFISFKFTKDPESAKIILEIANTPDNACDETGCHYVTGFTTPVTKFKTLKQMHITIYNKSLDGEYIYPKKLYGTAIHEIGHALGIMGHSYNPEDTMYSVEKGQDIYTQFRSDVQSLSEADKGTIRLLYAIDADITDEQDNKNNLIYAPLIIGSQQDRLNKEIEELENYIRQAPEIAAGYINLGGLYAENEEFSKAKKYLEEGLEHVTSSNDKYALYYNLAYVSYRMQDYEQSIYYCQKAGSIKQTEELLDLMNAIEFDINN